MVSKFDIGILIAVIAGLFFIIRGAGQKLDNITNPLGNISLPTLPDIQLPNFEIPQITLPNITNIFPQQQQDPFFTNIEPPIIPPQPEGSSVRINDNSTVFVGGSEVLGPEGNQIPNALLSLDNFARSLTPAQLFAQEQRGRDFSVPTNVPQSNGGFFQGGGESFIGGSVREIPIDRLSLGNIIERFGVTASQAVDIRSRARNDFDDFDFGSNTGSGIGSVSQENPLIRASLPNLGQTSNPEFEGLSAQEIAQRLTGGLINNF